MQRHPPWHELVIHARVRYLANLGTAPIAEFDARLGAQVVITGAFSNTLNGVWRARLDPASADAAIGAVLARFQRRQAPAIWFLDPGSSPADLPRRLEAAGCRPEMTGVVSGGGVVELLERAGSRAPPAEIVAVRNPAGVDRWFEAARDVWEDDAWMPPADLRRRELYAGLDLGPEACLQHWVAVDGGSAVGMASAFYAGELALIDQEGVVAAARRRGVGTALLRSALTEARRRGCHWAVLEPTPEGSLLYDTLGFTVERCRPDLQFYLPLVPARRPGEFEDRSPRGAARAGPGSAASRAVPR